LDIREINGYSIQYTPFHPDISSNSSSDEVLNAVDCMVYIGMPDNPQFLGPQDPQALAAHILKSKGPSGENREYLYMLGEALQALSPESEDEHVRDLIKRCRQLEAKGGWELSTVDAIEHDLHKIGSTEEQEEIEKDI
jgi:cation transport protein ChaC